MSSLLPLGSAALENNAALACKSIGDLNVPLRELWNPKKCPAKFLPYLAWAFSVDRWDEAWTETQKRDAVASAFNIHKRKGTVGAVRHVVESFGYSIALAEWWQVADPAGTFRLSIDVNDIGLTESMLADLERLIADAKPVSRHISRLDVITKTAGRANIGAALYAGEIITVYPREYTPDESIYYNGLVNYDGNYKFSGENDGEN